MAKIAILSDIHFGIYSRSEEFSVPGEPIHDKNVGAYSMEESLVQTLRDNGVENMFISGDLTSVASPQEFHFCEKKILDIAQKADIKEGNIIICLGNHDVDWKITKLTDEYCEKSKDFPIDIVREKYQVIAANTSIHTMRTLSNRYFSECGPAPFSGLVEKDEFIVFVLNSGWRCSHDQETAHGKLSEGQLTWLKECSVNYTNDPRYKLVLIHHHAYNYPFPTLGHEVSTLEEGSELIEIMAECGVDLVVHGHRHHPKVETVLKSGWKKPISFICAGSFSVNSLKRCNGEIPNTVHILDLAQDRISLLNYQYNLTKGWVPITENNEYTPLDARMLLGKIFDNNAVESSIISLVNAQNVIVWEDVPESLKYIQLGKLNQKVHELLSNTHKIIGEFPRDVVLIKK